MPKGQDMIVGVTNLPAYEVHEGVKLKKAFIGDKQAVLDFVAENFESNWVCEAERAIMNDTCFIATENGKILGFSCYDATAKGFFGPIGVTKASRGKAVGKALLIRTLEAMRDFGYGYAIIGWSNNSAGFYENTIDAKFIPNGEIENSIYANMISM